MGIFCHIFLFSLFKQVVIVDVRNFSLSLDDFALLVERLKTEINLIVYAVIILEQIS